MDMVAAPNGSSVFVASDASANILQAFAANTSTGTLSAPTQVAFTQPADLAVSSGGILAALSEQNISVAAYRVNAGALAAFGLPATTSVSAKAVSFSSGSTFVYVVSAFDSTVTAYSFDSGTGNIAFLGAEAVPAPQDFDTAALNHVAVDPLGRFLFASTDTGRVYVFTLSASTGLASFLRQISVTPGNRISSILISPDGEFLYVTDFTTNRVLGFAIVADGTLAPVSIAPPSTDVGPVAMSFDSTGRLLFTANQTNASITVFTRNSTTGVLTTLTPAVPTGGPDPTAITSIP
ncbi:MAG: beta-propeller fold lactonase family protein [Acidobacteriales bacterium]|nr:beta-propeller fold lactonase family protein [Terriglobales bacterium]